MARRSLFTTGVTFIGILLVAISCENDVDINYESDPIPVAYCILNMQDSVQTLRISQTYLIGGNVSTGEEILSEESFIYDAFLERIDGGKVIGTYDFHLVEFYSDGGSGHSNPYGILETSCMPNPDAHYELYVLSGNTELFRGACITIGNQVILDPLLVPGRELTLTSEQGYMLRWAPVKNARVYQTVLFFNYLEKFNNQVDTLQIRIPLRININSEQVHNISQFLSGLHFFKDIAAGMKPVPGIRRKATGLDFEIMAGGEELSIYIDQEIDGMGDFGRLEAYSNFNNAKGLLSSGSTKWIKDIRLSYITHDSLAFSRLTRNLGFVEYNEDL